MSWVAVGLTAGTAGLGLYQGSQKEKAEKKRNDANAEANKYSPWTKQHSEMTNNSAGAALGGAIGGAGMGIATSQSLNAGGFTPRPQQMGTMTTGELKSGATQAGDAFQPPPGMMGEAPQDPYWTGLMAQGPKKKSYFGYGG